ncbi:MAG: LysR family transcriptional regulator [Hoeflea sp.]|uniref:LysR family transcriptional regulator n=1 Tax=Hoeflea sp. TaxID=1940281 RepID=UPI001D7CD7FC|nr:LysR family transcriptional regulator [Hoeflea sp.]MBU4529527.1 LysR family transcriptional regulator [Alphaproteobacteria bacterium]MBU4546646.1 LysR family transcriptional regulator [Alphaproteobacteria bacterium]MBU4550914.1 LysR family transcriptional regulator [Alphaproteobacteria bacterium]MBV1723856.1 LysR family transcriptional regulator [Hoeflea sp.]MBV1763133.1 LysR family transcriptional regulator [Hoeflea sp.]
MNQTARNLQLKDFRLIEAIHETGQLALAAEQLSMSQPAASRMLAGIERIVGGAVFERHPKGMTPTQVGLTLIRNGSNLLNGLDQTLKEIRSLSEGLAGTARVGSVTDGAVAFVVPAIQQLKRTATGADIHVDVAPSDVLVEGLFRGEYDFVLSRIPPGYDKHQLDVRRGRNEDICFLMRTGHPLARHTSAPLADLAGFEWITQAPHSPLRQAVEGVFVSSGVALPKDIVNTPSMLVMIAYLASSDAIAPIPRQVAALLATNRFSGEFVTVDPDQKIIVSPYFLISHKSTVISAIASRLRDLVVAAMNQPAA